MTRGIPSMGQRMCMCGMHTCIFLSSIPRLEVTSNAIGRGFQAFESSLGGLYARHIILMRIQALLDANSACCGSKLSDDIIPICTLYSVGVEGLAVWRWFVCFRIRESGEIIWRSCRARFVAKTFDRNQVLFCLLILIIIY